MGWIIVIEPQNRTLISVLQLYLDAGEAEAIAIAVEQEAEILLIDEAEGREIAEQLGVRRAGSIGILLRAHREGKISSLKAEMDRLREEAGFWISDALYQQIIERETG